MESEDKMREVIQMIHGAGYSRNWEVVDRLERGLIMASAFYPFNKGRAYEILNQLLKVSE